MKTIFITGSNRGLGLEFTKQYLELGNQVIASCRNPSEAEKLLELKKKYPVKLTIIQLDVTKEDQRSKVFEEIETKFNSIDILINNAGVISGDGKNLYHLGDVHKENFMKVLEINTLAPLLLSEKFLPLLEKAKDTKIINITSKNGSITLRKQKGKYSYCVSKAALNMITKILSNDLYNKGITVLSIQPGWVQTDMGGPEAPLTPEESISKIIKLVNVKGIDDSGKFFTQDGLELPW